MSLPFGVQSALGTVTKSVLSACASEDEIREHRGPVKAVPPLECQMDLPRRHSFFSFFFMINQAEVNMLKFLWMVYSQIFVGHLKIGSVLF